MTAGYWMTTYWPDNYWMDDYWPEYGATPPPTESYWILIDDVMRWEGVWDEDIVYELHDVVIHKTDDASEYHVFTSKVGHNSGNPPNSSATYWRRLYQEPMQ